MSDNGMMRCIAHLSRIFHTKCNKHNAKTINAFCLSLDLKGLLERTTWRAWKLKTESCPICLRALKLDKMLLNQTNQHHWHQQDLCFPNQFTSQDQLQRPVNCLDREFSRAKLVTLETCSWNSWNYCYLLLSLEMLLKCVAVSWNSWNSWCSWNAWYAWNGNHWQHWAARACFPHASKNRIGVFKIEWEFQELLKPSLETLAISWNTLEMCCYLLKLLILLKCLKLFQGKHDSTRHSLPDLAV